ncbi:MAG: peptidase, partial [Verrucomicrobia bacterium]|nr:peptidase [Verrucomicrobiota bacterium]
MKRIIVLTAFVLAALTAAAVQPQFSNTKPTGLQRGTEGELTLNGSRLDDAQEIILLDRGVQVVKIEEVKANTVRVRFKVAPDCQLGEQKLRIRTATGLSELRTFLVSAYPLVEEKEPNNTPDKAQKVPANCTVEGTMQNEDIDLYLIEAKKGQRISAEVEGMRLGRTMFDPYVAILDKNGKVITKSDDTALFVQDCFVTMLAPADGEYIIEVREGSDGGGGNPHRVHIGHFPRPTAVYPPGGQAGQTLDVKFIGDAAGEIKKTVQLPAEISPFKQGVFAESDGLTAPSANPIRVSEFPNVLEQEPNDDAKSATSTDLELPL